MTNPSIPPRFSAGAAYSARFEDPTEMRPPALTAQAREDVERLRAKVRAHNPGYITTNGVALPSQLPTVPQLLDELATNVAAARTDREVPNTPLPEVEQSELAKAGFDWKAIADRAISALETGTRRPLPLANDPEAAQVPGLSIIAQMQAHAAVQPEETPEAPGLEPVAEPLEPQDETQFAKAISTEELTEVPYMDGHLEAAEYYQSGSTASELPAEAALEELAMHGQEVGDESPTPDFSTPEYTPYQAEHDLAQPADDFATYPEQAQPEGDDFSADLAQAEDLVNERVYDDQVLESAGNDDEVFVGDVDPTQVYHEEQIEELPPVVDFAAETAPEMEELEPLEEMQDLSAERVYDDQVLEAEGNDDELFVGDIDEVVPLALDSPDYLTEDLPEEMPQADYAPELAEELPKVEPAEDLAEELPEIEPAEEAQAELPTQIPQEDAPFEPADLIEETQAAPIEDASFVNAPESQDSSEENYDASVEEIIDFEDIDLGTHAQDLDSLEFFEEETAPGTEAGTEENQVTPVPAPEPQDFAAQEQADLDLGETQSSPLWEPITAETAAEEVDELPGSQAIASEPGEKAENEVYVAGAPQSEPVEEETAATQVLPDTELPLERLPFEEATAEPGLDVATPDASPLEENPRDPQRETAEPAEEEVPDQTPEFQTPGIQIPQVQGDIPEAMREDYAEAPIAEEPAVEEIGFETEEEDAASVKKPFWKRLLGR